MRLLFLADTHLGIDLPARPRVDRPRRGEDFSRNYERALAPALSGEVDAVLHGGDLLYRSRVPAWLAEAALAPLRRVAEVGVPVLLVPGNHERARIPYPILALHGNVHVFDRPRTVTLEARGLRVAFSGFPHAREARARFPGLLAQTGHRDARAAVRVLCLHQCVEGATCGPGDFTFRGGPDVIRRDDLPASFHAVLSGHVHRHQVLRRPGAPPIVYAGSIERTSFAEAGEPKGFVLAELGAAGGPALAFRELPSRPMVERTLSLGGVDGASARARVEEAIAGTPSGAVVRLRIEGGVPEAARPWLSAAALRAVAGGRLVSLGRPGGR